MADWTAHSKEQRGALIRYYFVDPLRAPIARNGVLDVTAGEYANNGGAAVFGANYNANQHPSRAQVETFKNDVIVSLRDYIDGFNFGFKSNVTNTQIGDLAGDNGDLTTGYNMNTAGTFVRSVGIGNDLRETGVERHAFDRDISSKAVLTPDKYIKDANEDLKRIDELSLNVYRESFRKYYDEYKYEAEEAKKMALRDKEVYYAMLKKQHDHIYKVDLFKQAKKRIVRNV